MYDNFGQRGTADKAMNSLRSDGGVFIFLPGKGGGLSHHPKHGVRQIDYGLFSSNASTYVGLNRLVDAGQLRAVVQQRFTLEDVADALTVSAKGHVVGKLGIDIEQSGVKCDAWLGGYSPGLRVGVDDQQ